MKMRMKLHPQFRTQNGDVFLFKFLSFLIIGMVHSYYLKFMWADKELHKLSKNDPTFLLEVAIFQLRNWNLCPLCSFQQVLILH